MKRLIVVLCLVPLLGSCLPPAVISECPREFKYAPQFWRNLDAELKKITPKEFPSVYTILRDSELTMGAIRACIRHRQR